VFSLFSILLQQDMKQKEDEMENQETRIQGPALPLVSEVT
jgi:hypothetical protein